MSDSFDLEPTPESSPVDQGWLILDVTVIERYCVECGYNLQGLEEPRCPECGQIFNPNQDSPPPIPWLRRTQIGAIRAYMATLFLVSFSPSKLRRMSTRGSATRANDALLFKRTSMLIGALGTGLVQGVAILFTGVLELGYFPGHATIFEAISITFIAVICVACTMVIWLWAATGEPAGYDVTGARDFMVAREAQALHCYGAGFCAWLPVVAVVMDIGWTGPGALFLIPLLIFLGWWLSVKLTIGRHPKMRRAVSLFALAQGLLLRWFLGALLANLVFAILYLILIKSWKH